MKNLKAFPFADGNAFFCAHRKNLNRMEQLIAAKLTFDQRREWVEEGCGCVNKTAKSALIGSGIAVAGAAAMGAVSHRITGYLMKVAMDRELPNIRHMEMARAQLCGMADADVFFKALERMGEKLRDGSCETVEIGSYDGEKLVGHLHRCEEPRRIIIAMHGWRSSWWRDFGIISDFWHDNHCTVLYVEQRGQNNSGGNYMGFGLTERFDCLEWAKWVDEQFGADIPIYLAGVSMGATTVLMASGLDLPANVRGIIADCGFTSPDAIWRHVATHNLHLLYALRSAAVSSICRKKIHMGADEYSTLAAMEKNRVPVLFIHGTDDHFVPVEMTYENYKACAAPKRLLVVPGADHGMSYLLDPAGYQGAMVDFWNTFDLPQRSE